MRIALPLLALVAGLVAGPAARADAFRCGNKLATEGDTAGEVAAKCGDPSQVERKSIFRPAVIWVQGRPLQVGDGEVEVAVEIWIYNLGPGKLMRRLQFEDGRLVAVETLGRGYPRS
jgi:hypothetical protein